LEGISPSSRVECAATGLTTTKETKVISSSKRDLAALVEGALAIADNLGFAEVGLRLDQALVALTGAGVAPPEVCRVRDEIRVTEFW
jgi:hypothetical protein